MELTNTLDMPALTRAYLFANTPMYIYKHFRRVPGMKEFARNQPVQSLIEEFNRQTVQASRTLEDVVVAYALLIAITFLDYDAFRSVIPRLSLSRLDWGREIMSIHKWMTKPTNVYYSSLDDSKPISRIAANSTVTMRYAA